MSQRLFFESLEQRNLLAANLIADLNTTQGGFWRATDVEQIGDTTFVRASLEDGCCTALWMTNGTPYGLEIVDPGPVDELEQLDGQIFYAKEELYRFAEGMSEPEMVANLNGGFDSDPESLTALDNVIVFRSTLSGGTSDSFNVYGTDGSESGTQILVSSQPQVSDFQVVNGQALFTAGSSSAGYTLWSTNGTQSGTFSMGEVDFIVDIESSGSSGYFLQDNGLWQTDGLTLTYLGESFRDSPTDTIRAIAAADSRAFFTVLKTGTTELWVADSGGVFQVDGVDASSYDDLTTVGDDLYFSFIDPALGREIGHSDGTAEGTGLLLDVREGPSGSNPRDLVEVGDRLVFSALPTVAEFATLISILRKATSMCWAKTPNS